MNKQWEMVKEFHTACSVEMPDKPTILSGAGEENNKVWYISLDEDSKTMKRNSHKGGEVKRRASYMLEELAEFMNAETLEDQADALGDLICFALGTYTLMGLKPENIFNKIQEANMRKVIDGKVLRNEQGKIVKPEGWYGPEEEIRKEIDRQKKGECTCPVSPCDCFK